MSPSEKYYVIAGNNNQFLTFAKEKIETAWYNGNILLSLSNFVYVYDPNVLRGLHNPNGFFVGTWIDHDFIREILNNLMISMTDDRKLKVIIELWDQLNEYEKSRGTKSSVL